MIPLTLTPGEARYGGPERHACVLRGITIVTGTGMKRSKAWSVVLHRVTLTFVLRTDTGVYSVRRGMAYTRDPVFKSVFPCTGISTCIQHRGTGVYSVFQCQGSQARAYSPQRSSNCILTRSHDFAIIMGT